MLQSLLTQSCLLGPQMNTPCTSGYCLEFLLPKATSVQLKVIENQLFRKLKLLTDSRKISK